MVLSYVQLDASIFMSTGNWEMWNALSFEDICVEFFTMFFYAIYAFGVFLWFTC